MKLSGASDEQKANIYCIEAIQFLFLLNSLMLLL